MGRRDGRGEGIREGGEGRREGRGGGREGGRRYERVTWIGDEGWLHMYAHTPSTDQRLQSYLRYQWVPVFLHKPMFPQWPNLLWPRHFNKDSHRESLL